VVVLWRPARTRFVKPVTPCGRLWKCGTNNIDSGSRYRRRRHRRAPLWRMRTKTMSNTMTMPRAAEYSNRKQPKKHPDPPQHLTPCKRCMHACHCLFLCSFAMRSSLWHALSLLSYCTIYPTAIPAHTTTCTRHMHTPGIIITEFYVESCRVRPRPATGMTP
jgi:hypothetical protein